MGCFRFLNQNFLDTDVVLQTLESSEQAAFPADNIYNQQRRSKLWRSNGYWDITSSVNEIVFEETLATPLTATIAVATYTSTTALQTAIKTAMEAVGASVYTVSTDTTSGKLKIESDGAGGGGILSLLWSDAGSTAASTLGFDATDQTGALSYLADALVVHTDEWLEWDMGLPSNPTALVLTGKRNQPLQISPSSTITIQGNETQAWTAPSFEEVLTYDSTNVIKFADDGFHTEGLRYWRIQIVDIDNPNGYVELGAAFLGDFYETVRGAAQFPFKAIEVDRTTVIFSEGGQTFSDEREKSEEFGVDWFGLTVAEKEELAQIFDTFGLAVPLFIVTDANAVFTSTVNLSVKFVKFISPPTFNLVSPGNFRSEMKFREEL